MDCSTSCGRVPGTQATIVLPWPLVRYAFANLVFLAAPRSTTQLTRCRDLIDYQGSISTISTLSGKGKKRLEAYLSFSPDLNQSHGSTALEASIENKKSDVVVFDGS